MARKNTSKRSPFAIDKHGNKYVETAAVMTPLVALIDCLPITRFGKEKKTYLDLDTAIEWVTKEMQHHSREKYTVVLEVLNRFKNQTVEAEG